MERDITLERLKLDGEEHRETLTAAGNYATGPYRTRALRRSQVVAAQKTMPVARRILRKVMDSRSRCGGNYAQSLYKDDAHARRSPRGRDDARGDGTDRAAPCSVSAYPITTGIEHALQDARAALRAREHGRRRPSAKFLSLR